MEVALFVHFLSKKRKRKKRAIEKFIPHTSCQTSPMKIKVINDDAEDITNKLHGPYALLLTPAQREKRIFTECTGVVPAKYPPKIKSELFSLL